MDNKSYQRKELTHQLVPAEVPLKIFSPIVQVSRNSVAIGLMFFLQLLMVLFFIAIW